MIEGHVNSHRELVVPVRLLDANEHVHRSEAVVDTGFEGYLSLSPEQIRAMGLRFSQRIDMVVATGRTFEVNSYFAIAIWRGERRPIRVLEAENTPLIGTALLWGSLLTAEVIDNGAITIGSLTAGISG